MNNPKISIIVAAYNVVDYIEKCLKSISEQTYQNLEIVIIDDGSSDGTAKKCKDFCMTERRAKVYSQTNQGLSAARNIGIKKSTADYIAFIDGDDFIDQKYVEKLYQDMAENNSDISVCGFMMYPSGQIEKPKKQVLLGEDATIKLLTEQENYQIISTNKLYKKSLFKNIEFPLNKKHEDSLTTYKIFAAAHKVSFIESPLYYYVQRSTSIMNSGNLLERLETKMEAALEAKKYFKKNKKLYDAALIAELLADYSLIDNFYIGNIKDKPSKNIQKIKASKNVLYRNQFLTKKLHIYIICTTTFGGILYKIFRKIKH